MNDIVSIVTPSYGSEKFIAKTIESVINQSYIHWEMIIVDDVSPDSSNKIIEKYMEKDSRIKLIKLEKNSGPAIARNRAIEEARGRFIAFLDADDLWYSNKLETQLNFLHEKDLAFTYASYDLIDEDDISLGTYTTVSQVSYGSMLKTCSIGCLTAIYDTDKLGKVFMPEIMKRQDYGLWLKILKSLKTTRGSQDVLATYRIRKDSVSSNKLRAAKYQWKIYREVEKFNRVKSSYYFIHYAINGLLKYK